MTEVTQDIAKAARMLREGKLVAFSTETVYGLGADATNDAAVAGIFSAKDRPEFNPLIVHVADRKMAEKLGTFNDVAERLADAFWPGPLTLVVPRRPACTASLLVSAGLPSIALRMPAHPLASELLMQAAVPVAAPSANPSGQISPTTTQHVVDGLQGRIDLVLDGGACPVGVESTIVDCTDNVPRLLREGGVTAEELHSTLGVALPSDEGSQTAPTAPGQLESHYAPRAPVRINVLDPHPGEVLLAFGGDVPEHAGPVLNLSDAGDLQEAAGNLFAMLHRADAMEGMCIAVVPIPDRGLGRAINDRLRRSAAPR